MKLRANPLCEHCFRCSKIEPATTVDHKVRVRAAGGQAFPPLDGLTSLCEACHNRKTRGEQLGRELPPLRKGCDENGYPLDPNHPVYRK
jgi:5-methylcytosine-specific restriction protein A